MEELNEDKAYRLLNSIIEPMEKKFGEISNVQTKHSGRLNFKYEVMFCNDKNKTTTKHFEVSIGNSFVKEVRPIRSKGMSM